MPDFARRITATTVGFALAVVSTGAIAAAPSSAPPPSTQQAQAAASTNPWLALSAMSSSSSAAAATAAAQGDSGPGFPPIAPLIVILGTIALGVWIIVHDDDDESLGIPPSPISPV